MLARNVSTGGIFFANKMRTQGYVTMLDPLQVCALFLGKPSNYWFPNLFSYVIMLDMKEKPTAAIVDQGMPDRTISHPCIWISLNSGPIWIPNGRSSLPARSLWRGLLVRWHPRRTWSVLFRLFEFYAQYIDKAMMMFSKNFSVSELSSNEHAVLRC